MTLPKQEKLEQLRRRLDRQTEDQTETKAKIAQISREIGEAERKQTTRLQIALGRGLLALAHNGNAGAIDAIQEVVRSASKRDHVLLAPTLEELRKPLPKGSRL